MADREPTTAAGCDGRDTRADVDTWPEKIGPRCGQPHVIEITREGWDRPVRLCPVHADQAHLTDTEKMTLSTRWCHQADSAGGTSKKPPT